jgi:nitroreductase
MTAALDNVLTTTRTVRSGLDFDRPLDLDLVRECLALARYAPNGANRQDWRFVVIDDAGLKAAVAKYYRLASEEYLAGSPVADSPTGRSARALAARIDKAPALLLACLIGRLAADAPAAKLSSFFGSVYPALWSFMLAARSRGLGTALTTVHLAYEREVAAVLGIPFDDVTQVALVVVGHRKGGEPRSAPRKPVDEVLSHNGWRWG